MVIILPKQFDRQCINFNFSPSPSSLLGMLEIRSIAPAASGIYPEFASMESGGTDNKADLYLSAGS
ncbi:hypothetical protein QUA20_25270 [Microcoleus sp. Pol7_A1]|uniref:hypothetical protein n=1 Tax=Microcoleus sp. Pol7_A1 TaxID=2818893 RepID=UPI002FD09CA8